MFIKLYGLQRTRTNYMQVLLNMNLPQVTCLANVGGWKHGYVQNIIDWTGENWEEHPAIGAEYLEKNFKKLLITEKLNIFLCFVISMILMGAV